MNQIRQWISVCPEDASNRSRQANNKLVIPHAPVVLIIQKNSNFFGSFERLWKITKPRKLSSQSGTRKSLEPSFTSSWETIHRFPRDKTSNMFSCFKSKKIISFEKLCTSISIIFCILCFLVAPGAAFENTLSLKSQFFNGWNAEKFRLNQ